MRYNGCEPPLHPQQIAAWILIPVFAVVYFGLYIPFLPLYLAIPVGIVMFILVSISVATGLLVTTIDPSDPNVNKDKQPNKLELPTGKHVIDENNFCSLCEVFVGPKSKHCRLCDKCVSVFDHHCKWLNNCIGERNYREFFIFVGSTFCCSILHGVIGAFILFNYLADDSDEKFVEKRAYEFFGSNFSVTGYLVVVAIFSILSLPAIFLLGQLFFLHVSLKRKGITTYEMIVQERVTRERRLQEEKERKEQQSSAKPGRIVPSPAPTETDEPSVNDIPMKEDSSLSNQSNEKVSDQPAQLKANKTILPPITKSSWTDQ